MTGPTAPAVLPAAGWRFPSVQESALGNGIRLLTYQCPGQYIVSATLLFDVPLSAEPPEIEGVAGLVARCLMRGAGGLSADDFSDALAACGGELDAAATADGFAVRLTVPASHLTRGLDLMSMAVRDPTYAPRDVDQEQRLRLQEIEQGKAYPGAVTAERLNGALFGDARAARPVGGTAASVEAVTRDDVARFTAMHLQPSNAVLILGGDLAAIDAAALAAGVLGGWTHQGQPPVEAEAPDVSRTPRLLLVDWPDAPQATVRIAGPGITRGDPRWAAMFVANYAVGGSFGSRLNTVLREQKGFTYGVGSNLDTGRRVAVLGVGASVRSDAAAEAVGDVLSLMRDARGTLTDEEVSTGIRAASDSAALSFERGEAVVARAEMLVSQGLPLDHVDANLQRIRRVTTADANETYASVVDPSAFTIVVAGDAGALADPLAELAHAPVEVLPRP